MTKEKDALELQNQFLIKLAEQGKGLNTLKNYKADLNCFLKFLNEKQRSNDITDFNIGKVIEYSKFIDLKYNSDNSKRRRIQTVRLFFDFLVAKGIYSENPIRKIQTAPKFLDIPRPTSMVQIKRLWWELDKALEAEIDNNKPLPILIIYRNMIIIQLIYGSGLKVSDLEELEMSNISIGKKNSRILITGAKKNPYTIPLIPTFKELFSKYCELLKIEKERSKIDFKHLLFNANPHKILSGGLTSRGLEITFEELKNKYKIDITAKSLRQSCIFKWLNQNIEESTIKDWIGVAPSYSLKPYRDLCENNFFEEL